MDYTSRRWFNVSAPVLRIGKSGHKRFVWLWTCHRRYATDYNQWGVGLLQIGNRHMAYIGHIHEYPYDDYPASRYWQWSFLFVGRTR